MKYYASILVYTLIVCALFIRWVLKNKKPTNNPCADRHLAMYFMDEKSHGLYCGRCNKIIDEEFYGTEE